jgi:nitrite reductase/ring-hydroxylating ferredoxin subunit
VDAERPFERVCGVHDLVPGRPLGVTLSDGARVCLVAHAGVVHAVSDRCPHLQFPLSEGEVDPTGEHRLLLARGGL